VLRSEDQDDCIGFSTNRNASAGNTCTVPRHGKHLAGAPERALLPFAHVDRYTAFAGQATPICRPRHSDVKSKGMTIFAPIDHAAGAKTASLALRQPELLIFGNAKAGTPLMQSH
jgi:hypothetical protein